MAPASCGSVVLSAALAVALASHDPPRSTVPQPRADEWGVACHAELLKRARTSQPAPVVFIGDSITQGWEEEGRAVWAERFAPLGAVNLGASGDRTEHVLWRLREAPISRLEPKHVVVMIGTNNVGHGSDGADGTLAGVRAVVEQVRAQATEATVILCAIFPRGAQMNPMRGELLQVNQALSRAYPSTDATSRVRFVDLGDRFIEADGSIPASLMPDGVHLSAAGYSAWADALKPLLPAPQASPKAESRPPGT